jgi:hypothetical protein
VALNGIRYAQLNRLACEVAWGSRSLYYDPAERRNAWSYFFNSHQFDFAAEPSEARLGAIPYYPGAHDFIAYPGLSTRRSVAAAIARFCAPRPDILAEVEAFAADRFRGGRMIGVHFRGTDAAKGHEGRRTLDVDDFVCATRRALGQAPDAGVFLATDEAAAADRFAETFGEDLVLRDCIRSRDGTSIHGHYDAGISGGPELKGREVLIDALLLARCGRLVRGHSRVSCYSLCANPELEFIDLELDLLGVDRTPWLRD